MRVMILYHTKTGHTLEAATATAAGIRSAGSDADLLTAKDWQTASLVNYDALIVGSPCWAGSMGASGIAGPLEKALRSLPEGALRDKQCGAISVNSFLGGEKTIASIAAILQQKGCTNPLAGPVVKAGVPMSLWKGPSVGADDLERLRAFGSQFVS